MSDEVLGGLLPDAVPEERARMRRVITALRVMRDDARTPSRHSAPSWPRARAELESARCRQRRRAIDGLLHAYLSALRPAESFLELGPCPVAYDAAWSILLGPAGPGVAGFPPDPAEPPARVVERLLAMGRACGAVPAWSAFWSACLRHLLVGPARAERHWAGLVSEACAARAHPVLVARWLGGLVAARLEAFQPARAWALYAPHATLAGSDPALRRLFGWSALCNDDLARARDLLVGLAAARLPRALLELRAERPEWAALLAGEGSGSPTSHAFSQRLDRRVFGGRLLGVFVCRREGGVRVLALDVARGWRRSMESRLERLATLPRAREVEIRRQRGPAPGAEGLPESLTDARTRALARVGIAGPDGELAGWVQLECEHQLLPARAILRQLARGWRAGVLLARRTSERSRAAAGPDPAPEFRARSPDDPRAVFSRRLFRLLDFPPGWRASWVELAPNGRFLVRDACGTVPRASGSRGGAAALRRASELGTPLVYARDAAAALHGDALVGLVVPLVEGEAHHRAADTPVSVVARQAGRRTLGLLVVESPRAEADGESLRARATAVLQGLAGCWWAGEFRAFHLAREGHDLVWDPEARFLAALEAQRAVGGSSSGGPCSPELLLGEPGSGRRTLARWLHFRWGHGRLEAGSPIAWKKPGLELETLSHETQQALCRRADRGEGLVFYTAGSVREAVERGVLGDELARRLPSRPILVPPLRARRDEIPALVRSLVFRIARSEGLAPLRFEDRAMGALWRQDWPGHIRQLADWLAPLARARPGATLGELDVRQAFRAAGLAFRERLAGGNAGTRDLECALASTRHASGNPNQARAARYLGWHPATLASCLRLERERESTLATETPARDPEEG